MANNRITKKPGIYIHIPFCIRKCNYCAFLSLPAGEEARECYVRALLKEIKLRAEVCSGMVFDTVYFGGGTPTLLTNEQLGRVLAALRANYQIDDNAEITLEANPGTLGDGGRLAELREFGFNRLSMGVQSMDDDRLRMLGRIHDSGAVMRDFVAARNAGFGNINLDIIFSVPWESVEDALGDIRAVATMKPEHISFYSLQLEEGTPFFEMWERKEFEEVSDEDDRFTYHRGAAMLQNFGYEHYEISNFAKPGFESRHNSKYWNSADYLGLGLGASGYLTGADDVRVRYSNSADLQEYCDLAESGELPLGESHRNTPHDDISEAVFTGLRRKEGIRYADFFDGTEAAFREYYREELAEAQEFVDGGFLIIDDEGLRLTEAGVDISNRIMALFV